MTYGEGSHSGYAYIYELQAYGLESGGGEFSILNDVPAPAEAVKITAATKINYHPSPLYYHKYQFYDGLGRVLLTKALAETNPAPPYPARQVISGAVTYNNRGQVEKKYLPVFVNESPDYVEPDYNTVYASFTYDPLGRLIKTANPDGTYAAASFAPWSRTTTDENGHYISEHYDAYGKIIKVEEHNASQTYTTRYNYDASGNLTKTIDDQANTAQIWYDSLGRKVKMDDPDMGAWSYEYDAAGNLIKQTDAKGQVLEFTYDVLNRLTGKQANGQTLAAYQYDDSAKANCIGRLSKITDQSGSTEFFYDNLGREVKSIKSVDGSSYQVERAYDAVDRLVSLKYPDGEIVNYSYNPQGIEQVQGAVPYVTNIDYSPVGQILKIQYGNGAESVYNYNPYTLRLDNLTTRSPSGKIQDLNYSFDNAGNIAQLTDYVNTATQSFIYDDLNRLIQAQGAYGSFNYTYDSIGNMLYKEGVNLTYGRNGRLPHAVTQFGDTTIDYDANGNMLKKGNLEFSYDIENRLVKAEDKPAAQQILSVALKLTPGWNFISLPVIPQDAKISAVLSFIAGKYDQVSRYNPTTKKFEHYVSNTKYDQFTTFEYGRGYQIYITSATDVTLNITGSLPQTAAVPLKTGYNLISCPKSKETIVEQALLPLKLGVDYSSIYHYNKDKQLFEKYDAVTSGFANLVPGKSYYLYCLKDTAWNTSNTKDAAIFVYDGDGGRVKKTTGENSTVYIGSLFEKDSDGAARKHIFAGTNRLATVEPADTFYSHSDHLGSSNVITDSTGAQVGLTEFSPYGSISKQTGAYDPRHKFTGKELDAATGLYFYGARYYDPEIGRFISADTIVQSPYDPQSLNRYSYCRNNPINYVDPSGHSWKSFWKKVGDFFSDIGKSIAANPGAFVASLVAGFGVGMLASSFLAPAMGSFFSAGGTHAISAAANAIITGTEFGLGGFAGGFVGTLAGGGSLRDAFKAGGIGFGIGFGIGGLAGYTYATGFQDFLHGFDVRAANQNIFLNQIGQGNYAGASQSLAIDNTLKIRVKGAKVHFSNVEGMAGITESQSILAGKDGFAYLADLLPFKDNPAFTANSLQLTNALGKIDISKGELFLGLNTKGLALTPQLKITPGWTRFEYLHAGNINLANTEVYGLYQNNPAGHVAYIKDVLSSQ